MSDISPVLASFLAGKDSQTSLLEKGNEYKLRKEQLDQAIKQFDAEMKMRDKEHLIHQQTVDLERNKAIEGLKQNWMKQFMENPASAPGTQPTLSQGMERADRIGPDGLPEQFMAPVNEMVARPPTPGTMITMPSQFGDITIPMPQDQSAKDLATEVAKEKALFPFRKRLYKETIGDENTKKLENQVNMLGTKLDSQAGLFKDKLEMQEKLANLRSATDKELADIRASAAAQHMLFNMGFGGGENMKDTVLQYARDRATGKMDPASIKGQPLNNHVERAMRELGLNDLPGGAKTRQTLMDMAEQGSTLINKFDDIDSLYPASDRTTGKMSQAARNVRIPFFGPVSDLGTKYTEFESNLMNYAKTSSGITSSRLMDSNKEQSRFKGSLVATSDSKDARQDKRLNLIDNIFSHIHGNISGLSDEQRKDFWIDMFKQNPTLQKLGEDPTFRNNVMKQIFSTGNYDSSFLNKMRRSGKQ